MTSLEVELFTVDHAIRGYIETGGERLSDVMNNRKQSSAFLNDAYMIRLFNAGNAAKARLAQASVDKSQILFARPVQADLTHKSLYRRATRQLYQVAVNLPSFEIRGVIHLTGKFDIARVLIERPEDFIPITNCRATYMFNPRLEIAANIFVINKQRITLIAEIKPEPANPNLAVPGD
jgi:hypothetical protein